MMTEVLSLTGVAVTAAACKDFRLDSAPWHDGHRRAAPVDDGLVRGNEDAVVRLPASSSGVMASMRDGGIGLAIVGCGTTGRIRALLARENPAVRWLGLCDRDQDLVDALVRDTREPTSPVSTTANCSTVRR